MVGVWIKWNARAAVNREQRCDNQFGQQTDNINLYNDTNASVQRDGWFYRHDDTGLIPVTVGEVNSIKIETSPMSLGGNQYDQHF
jgi:hypothetical protein